ARARHLNSVHGVYLKDEVRSIGRELLPLASLNSVTLLNAEMVGRSYGGGILKVEPREADIWAMPSPDHVAASSERLKQVKAKVATHLRYNKLAAAVELVDDALLIKSGSLTNSDLARVRAAQLEMSSRR